LSDGEPANECDGEDVKITWRWRASCAAWRLSNSVEERRLKGISLKRQRTNSSAHVCGHLTAAPAKHYLRPIHIDLGRGLYQRDRETRSALSDNPRPELRPLADAYRKAGLIDNAVELCQTGLKLHPITSAPTSSTPLPRRQERRRRCARCLHAGAGSGPRNIIALRGLANSPSGQEVRRRSGMAVPVVERGPMNGTRPKRWRAPREGRRHDADHQAGFRGRARDSRAGRAEAAVAAFGVRPEVENFENPSASIRTPTPPQKRTLEVQEDVELNAQQIEQVEIEGLARTQYEGSGMFKLDGPEPGSRSPDQTWMSRCRRSICR